MRLSARVKNSTACKISLSGRHPAIRTRPDAYANLALGDEVAAHRDRFRVFRRDSGKAGT